MKNLSKYFSLIALLLIGAFTFTACLGDDDKDDDDNKKEQPTKGNMYDSYFMEPCIQWGASTSTVKSFMSKYDFEYAEGEDEYDSSDNITTIYFFPKYKEEGTAYMFEGGSKGTLVSSMIMIKDSYAKFATLRTLLKGKGYNEFADNDGVIFLLSSDQKTGVVLANAAQNGITINTVIWTDINYLMSEDAKSRADISIVEAFKARFPKILK